MPHNLVFSRQRKKLEQRPLRHSLHLQREDIPRTLPNQLKRRLRTQGQLRAELLEERGICWLRRVRDRQGQLKFRPARHANFLADKPRDICTQRDIS